MATEREAKMDSSNSIKELCEAVKSLTMNKDNLRCFRCQKPGHKKQDCPTNAKFCTIHGAVGHDTEECQYKQNNGSFHESLQMMDGRLNNQNTFRSYGNHDGRRRQFQQNRNFNGYNSRYSRQQNGDSQQYLNIGQNGQQGWNDVGSNNNHNNYNSYH